MSNYKDLCPYCFSSNLAFSDQPIKSDLGMEIEVFCRDCGEEWVEIDNK